MNKSDDEKISGLNFDGDSEESKSIKINKKIKKKIKTDKIDKTEKKNRKRKIDFKEYVSDEASESDEKDYPVRNKEKIENVNKDFEKLINKKKTTIEVNDIQKRFVDEREFTEEEIESSIEDSFENEQFVDLPTINDPKLFEVRCKIGCEKEAVICLTNKYFSIKDKNKRYKIFSCYQIDKYLGSIFIEAMKEFYVKEIVKGLNILNENNIKIVNIKEIISLITPDPTRDVNLKVGQFVRIKKNRIYENDLGMVEYLEEGGKSILVRLVPRLPNKDDDKNIRPLQKFFNHSDYPESKTLDMGRPENVYYYKGKRFIKGYILKKFKPTNIESDNVVPKYNEIRDFQEFETRENGLKYLEMAKKTIEGSQNQFKNLEKGEQIKIIKGDLKDTIGIVIDLDEKTLTIKPIGSDFITENVQVHYDEIQKNFNNSEHVIIISGRYKNLSGSIINIEDNYATIITDEHKDELKININNLKRFYNNFEKEIRKNNDKNLSIFDLIWINDNKTYGIIVKILQDKVIILDSDNVLKTFNKFEIKSKITKMREINNCHNQKIHPKCKVRVLEGRYKQTSALVKQIYNNYLFLHNQNIKENSGIFVELADNCYLIGSNIYDNTHKHSQFNKLNSNNNNNMDENQSVSTKNFNRFQNRKDLIGKKFKIIKGEYVGHEGIVKSRISDDRMKFELNTINKTLNLTLDYIGINNDNKNNMNYNFGKTPIERINNNSNYYETPAYNPEFNN